MKGRSPLVLLVVIALIAGMGRRILVLLLGSVLLAGCGQPAATQAPGSSTSASAATSPGQTQGAPSSGPGSAIEASTVTSIEAFAAAEDAIGEQLVRKSGVLTALGAEGWAWAKGFIHEELAKGGETLTRTGEAGLMASVDGGLPLTAIKLGFGGYGAAGAAAMIQQALQGSGPPNLSGNGAPVTSTKTINGQTITGSMTFNLGVKTAGSTVEGDVTFGLDLTVTDATTGALIHQSRFESHGKLKLDFCPDVNGKVKGHVQLDMQMGAVGAGAAGVSVTADIEGTVDDAAYLTTVDITGQSNQTTTAPGSATPRSQQVQLGYRAGVNRNGSINGGSIGNITGGLVAGPADMTQEEYNEGESQIVSAASMAVWAMGDAAQSKWRNGACVEIRATEQTRDVQKNELVQFESKVWHKIENVELNKHIVNDFTGKLSLDPVGIPVPAPVTNSFKAGQTANDTGTIVMTSTSNRGIGTLSITFTVKGGWIIDTPNYGGRLSGLKCGDPAGEWVVEGTYGIGGMNGEQTWTINIDAVAGTGTFTYRQSSEGYPGGSPIKVFVVGTSTGNVTAFSIDPVTGMAHMQLKETSHSYTSKTEFGGFGQSVDTDRLEYDFDWDTGGNC